MMSLVSHSADPTPVSRGLILVAIAAACGCSRSVQPPDVIAEVGGEIVQSQQFETYLDRNVVEGDTALGSSVLSELLDQFLEQLALRRLAIDSLGLQEQVGSREGIQELLAHEAAAVVDEADVAERYRQDLESYRRPERIRLRQILMSDRATAEVVREVWATGAAYHQLVERFDGQPGFHVGEEGEFAREDLPAALAEALFPLAEGEVSEVLSADYGFHVFQVVRHLPAGVVSLAEVAREIRTEMEATRRQEAMSRLVTRARERYNVRVFERNLPFDYVGRFRPSEDQTPR